MMENVFEKLNTPQKVQDYLDKIPFNFEKEGETYHSPKVALKEKKMHCFEGALFAVAALHYHGIHSYLVDLKTNDLKNDADHVIVVFKTKGKHSTWGALSKTNHAVLRYRDPIYPSVKTLIYSYFHEYFLSDGRKTLQSYSGVFDVVKKFGTEWIHSDEELDEIALALDQSRHYNFYSEDKKALIRKAGKTEIEASLIEQFKS